MPFTTDTPDAIVPASTDSPGIPGDICPQGWDEDFDRSQMSTQVMIGRQLPSNIPTLLYEFTEPTIDGLPPLDGTVELFSDGSDFYLFVSKQQLGTPTDVSGFLGYLKDNDTVRLTSPDGSGRSITFRVTAPPISPDPPYVQLQVFNMSGVEGSVPLFGEPVWFDMSLLAEPPLLFIDSLGKSLYGVETFNRTDLINSTTELFETLADRILEVRGVNSVPRVDAVTLDARTGFGISNMELMSTAAPEKPSRYRLRLAVDERPIFDRMCFVSGVRHFIAGDEWTLRINLDIAEWAGVL